MHRFFIAPDLITGSEVFFPADLAHQLTRVLRLRVGDRVTVLDDSGAAHEVELHTIDRRTAQGTIQATTLLHTEPHTALTLYLALLKGKKLELVIQKATELGVSRFVPMLSRRAVVASLQDLGDARLDRWETIVREAAEQSGRARLPTIAEPLLLESALRTAHAESELVIMAWEESRGQSLQSVLALAQPASVALFVGPEGGFEAEEVAIAERYGVQIVTLGPRILRAETAAIAMTAATMFALGEWE